MSSTTFRSVVWTGVERFGTQVFQAIFTVILARLLMPEDYGLIAMIFVFLMIGQMLMDGGLSLALIQKKNPTEADFSTTFWFNIAFGLFFYLVFFACAPLLARFYGEPQLVDIIRVAGLNVVVWSLGVVHNTKFDIALNFQKQAIISLISIILSGILGITLAYYGYGVWALVFQFLSNSSLKVLCFWLLGERWKPQFIFNTTSFKSLFKFGSSWILASFLDTTFKNMYAVFIGKFYSTKETGCFQQSSSLSNLATTNIAYTINRSFIPQQSASQHDTKNQHQLFQRYLSLACFIIFPIGIFLAILAKPFVAVVLTEKWLPAVPFIQILSISYLGYAILVNNHSLLLSKGFSKQNLILEIISKAFGFVVFFICLPHGVAWICASIGFYTIFDVVLSIIFVRKILSIRWLEELKLVLPILGLALFSGFVAWFVVACVNYYAPTHDLLKLLLGGISGVSVYAFGSYLLKFDEVKFVLKFFKR